MSRFIQYGGGNGSYVIDNQSQIATGGSYDDTIDVDDMTSAMNTTDHHTNDMKDKVYETTRELVLNNKTNYYKSLIYGAPSPLDQSPDLTDILKQDLRQIAKILLAASENGYKQTPYFFKSCVVSIANKNNIRVPEADMERFAAELKQKGLDCIVKSREALHNLNSNSVSLEACNDIINDIFVTYMWSLSNTGKEEE